MGATDMATMTISYPAPDGEPGIDDDPENPQARALAPLMDLNKQLPGLRLAFLSQGEHGPLDRWLGIFIPSPGDRILFVPGFDVTLFRVRGTDGEKPCFGTIFDLDHVSLQKDRATWHIKGPWSRAHQSGAPTLDSGERRVDRLVEAGSCPKAIESALRRRRVGRG